VITHTPVVLRPPPPPELSDDELSDDELSDDELSDDELSEDELPEEELFDDELFVSDEDDSLCDRLLLELDTVAAATVLVGLSLCVAR